MKTRTRIEFILTGGTIDSFYDGSIDTVIPNKQSIIPETMRLVQSSILPRFTTVCLKDSRDLTAKDLRNILKAVQKSPCRRIIIAHGTYTIARTARFLESKLPGTNKTIILTASIVPIKGFSPSDGTFNLGYAVAQAEHLSAGIYVAMNAKIFTPQESPSMLKERKRAHLYSRRF